MLLDKGKLIVQPVTSGLIVFLLALLTGCGTAPSQKKEESGTLRLTEAVKVNRLQYEKLSPKAKDDFDQAIVEIQKDNHKKAEALLKKISKENPRFLSAPVNLGIIYYKTGRIPEAEGILKGVVKVDATNVVAYNYLGIVYRQQGKFKEAESAYKSALEVDPNYANAHLNLGILYDLYFNKLDEALERYNKYVELSGEDKEVKKWIFDLKSRNK